MEEENKNEEIKYEEPKQKSNKVFAIVIIVIACALIIGGGIILSQKLLEGNDENKNTSKEDKNTVVDNTNTVIEDDNGNDNDDNEIVNVDINDVDVQRLFNIFKYDEEKCFLFGEVLNTSNTARLRVAYSSMPISYEESTSCKDYTPVLRDQNGELDGYCGERMSDEMAEYYVDIDKDDKFADATLKNVTKKFNLVNLENQFKSIFSNNFSFNPEDFGWGASYEPGCQTYKYYQDKNEFVEYSGECGGTCGSANQSILNAYKQGNKLFIETEYLHESNQKTKVNYEFILEDNNYKFLKVTEI